MKVSDIRPLDAMADQAAAMQYDIDWLAARKAEFVHVSCPACDGDEAVRLYEKYGLDHHKCGLCGTQYANPRPSAELLGEFYGQSKNYEYWAKFVFPASSEMRREKLFRPRAEAVAEAADKYLGEGPLGLLEVGAAYGLFCDEVQRSKRFARVVGIEPTPDLAQICRDLNIEIIESPYEKVSLDAPVDIVAHFEVIEHLFDPKAFLMWCRGQLRDNGLVVFTCPNVAGFETIVLGRESGAIDHEHINMFTLASMTALLDRCGFDVLEAKTPGVLDVEIVQNAVADGLIEAEELGPIVTQLIAPERATAFQRFLSDNNLSSNMMIVAQRR